jgi:glycosyltransferase involved in cell wall biosynthesis
MKNIAVLIPCYNEELTILKVIKDFERELPEATIYVYDNNSIDNSVDIVINNGTKLRKETLQGKGNVVRSMFRDIESDIYIIVDADDTYPANMVHKMLAEMEISGSDMVCGDRLSQGIYADENKRLFHDFGNGLVKWLINILFNSSLNDIMTGYRVFNRRFVKNIPIMSPGFEVETEMTLHGLDKRYKISEIPITYVDRPPGSESKLNTFSDGYKVLKTIFWLFKDYKPLTFFSLISAFFFILSVILSLPVFTTYINTGFVPQLPTAILSLGLMIVSFLSLSVGFILDTVVKQHKFLYELSNK